MPLIIFLYLLAIVVFNFWLWKVLRLEHEPGLIFEIGFWLSLSTMVGLKSPVVWLGLVTVILIIYSRLKKIDFWQWWDIVLPVGLLLFAPIAPRMIALTMVICWFFLLAVAKYYRRFGWYKSGRMGLVGAVACVAWAGVQIEVANGGVFWIYLGLVIALTVAGIIYTRSGQNIWLSKRNHQNP